MTETFNINKTEGRLSPSERTALGLDADSFQMRMEARLERVRRIKDENTEEDYKREPMKILKEENVRS